jgi:hypothetical protein
MLFDIKNIDIVYGNVNLIDSNNKSVRTHNIEDSLTESFFLKKTICHQAVIQRKSLFDEFGLYNTRHSIVADYDKLFEYFISEKKFKKIDITVCNYRIDGYSMKNFFRSSRQRQLVIRRRLGHLPLKIFLYHCFVVIKTMFVLIRNYLRKYLINSTKKKSNL